MTILDDDQFLSWNELIERGDLVDEDPHRDLKKSARSKAARKQWRKQK
jgi:hypothetical protein